MKKLLLVGLLGITVSGVAQARNEALFLPIDVALNSPEAKEVLDPSIPVYFAKGKGKIIKADLVSNRKTNAFAKSDEKACIWAFLSAVKQFQETAKKEGGTKVINLVSYYKKKVYSSTTKYECHAGAVVAGVALKGDIAR